MTTRHPRSILRRSGRTLLGVALALTACDDESADFAADTPEAVAPVDDVDASDAALELGAEGPEVADAYAYLRRYGYFPNPELAARYPGWTPVVDAEPDDPALFDTGLAEALAEYQEAHGLPVTGRLDAASRALMQQPRCAHPDRHASPPVAARPLAVADDDAAPADPHAPDALQAETADPSAYQFFPAVSSISDLRYGIVKFTGDVSQNDQRVQVNAAAKTWSSVGPVVLTNRTSHDVSIHFVPPDAATPKLAPTEHSHHSPPNCSQSDFFYCHTTIYLNDAFAWGTGGTTEDIQTHVLHQLGHALGLAHSADPSAVMYASITPGAVRRTLSADDITGLKALYPTYRDLRVYEPLWYLQLNPLLSNALGGDQATGSNHWAIWGRGEGRSASPAFDVTYYQQAYPVSVPKNYVDALWHWREVGLKEGRRGSPAFDAKYYLNRWPDLKLAFGTDYATALVHWMTHGITEARRASVDFDPAYYLANNPTVANTFGSTNYRMALVHWLTVGRSQGLKSAPNP